MQGLAGGGELESPPPSFSLGLKLMATSEVAHRPHSSQEPGGKLQTRPCHQAPPWLVTTSQKQELKPPVSCAATLLPGWLLLEAP